MREFVKSSSSLMLALSLFGLKQIGSLVTPRDQPAGRAAKAMNSITNATVDQFGETLRGTFRAFDNMQRGLIGVGFSFCQPFWSAMRPGGRSHAEPGLYNGGVGEHEVLAVDVLTGNHSGN